MSTRLHRLAALAVVLAFCVVVLGAWVRLSHAGLGCPDWPGCYGQLTWPNAPHEVADANQAFPERPVETHKAWKEMLHRYLAGALVLVVLALNVLAWRGGPHERRHRGITALLLALIVFQALLGMWTVTLKLLPVVVMAHLLGGMATLALLTWLWLRSRTAPHDPTRQAISARPLVLTALAVLVLQIALGGWVSANYAALSCPDLPTCNGQWWPDADFAEGFVLWREVGVDYEGGVLDQRARTAIQLAHRIGAVITLLVLALVSFALMRRPVLARAGVVLLLAVAAQFTLGVLNVVLYLPLPNAVAHNAGAAVLLMLLTWLLHRTNRQRAAVG